MMSRSDDTAPRGVIFDLDGTLLDTIGDIGDAMNAALAARGFPQHSRDAYRQFIGDGATELVRRTLPEDKRAPRIIQSCLDDFKAHYAGNWHKTTRPYPGIPEMLAGIANKNIPMAVFSNKPHAFTRKCVEGLLGDFRFTAVLGKQDTLPPKPDPAGALLIAAQMGIHPAELLYVGDTGTDMQTACNAGMQPAGVLWGYRSRDELVNAGAAYIIYNPDEIVSIGTAADVSDRRGYLRCRAQLQHRPPCSRYCV